MRIAWDPLYILPLPPGHRFPMLKYELIPAQLLHEGTIEAKELFTPEPMEPEVICLTHTEDYYTRLLQGMLTAKEIRKIGFPWSADMAAREVMIAHGTVQAARFALTDGVAFNVAGGTHHAFADRGEGFCMFNDIGVAANWLLQTGEIKQALVIDLDVHQGNGTAAIFEGRPDVFTFSMHGAANFPMHKERSDLDIPLADGSGDEVYLSILKQQLPLLMDQVKPDFIFYLSGVDVLATDKLGRLGMSREGCKERDSLVLQTAYRHGIPITASMGGGYSPDIRDIVEAHCNTYRLAKAIWD